MTVLVIVGLIAWGVFVAVDLVTMPQGLFSRPLVAATVAGAITGNMTSGLVAGMVLELYALDVLPIGASRYPDYGPAAVAAGAASALVPQELVIGVAGLVGLPLAVIGGYTLHVHRRRNAMSVQRRLARVSAGDARAIWELQRNGLVRDAGRGLVLSVAGVIVALVMSALPWSEYPRATLLNWATAAGGLSAVLGGALRSGGHGARRLWLGAGLAVGLVVVLLQ
ncbi:MAG: PTS sugar transporter subunit IIC [Gemmatimonadales bacterium]